MEVMLHNHPSQRRDGHYNSYGVWLSDIPTPIVRTARETLEAATLEGCQPYVGLAEGVARRCFAMATPGQKINLP